MLFFIYDLVNLEIRKKYTDDIAYVVMGVTGDMVLSYL